MDLGLKGLNALVTGGTKGIGRRAADMFAAEGANVSICARNAGEIAATVDSLKAQGVKAFEPDLSQFDLGSPTVDEDSPPEPWEAPPAAVRLSPEKSKWPAAASDGSSSSSGPTEVSPVLGRPASSHQLPSKLDADR